MSTFKKAKVVMLPTKEKVNIGADNWYLRNTGVLVINGFKSNLYFITDDEIKEGDWFILLMDNDKHELHQFGKNDKSGIRFGQNNSWTKSCKKIIATTDITLNNREILVGDIIKEGNNAGLITQLPQPSPEFIAKYIKAYNEGNVISDVLVEHESYCTYGDNCPSKGAYDKEHLCNVDYKLKINSKDNTITIKKVIECVHPFNRLHWIGSNVFCNECKETLVKSEEKVYRKDDVEDLMRKAYEAGDKRPIWGPDDIAECNNWVNKNLK